MLVVARFAGRRIIGPLPVDILGWCLQELDQTPIVGRTSRWLALLAGASLLKKRVADVAGALFEKMSSKKWNDCMTMSDRFWRKWRCLGIFPLKNSFVRFSNIGIHLRAFGPLRLATGGTWAWALWFVNGRRKLDFRFRFEERKHCPLSWWCTSAVFVHFLLEHFSLCRSFKVFCLSFLLCSKRFFPQKKRNTGTRKWSFGSDESLFHFGGDFQVNQTVCFRGSRQQPGAIFEQFACHGPVLHRLKTSATLSFCWAFQSIWEAKNDLIQICLKCIVCVFLFIFQSPSPRLVFFLSLQHVSHEKNPYFFPLYWLVNKDPYNIIPIYIYICIYNWVV